MPVSASDWEQDWDACHWLTSDFQREKKRKVREREGDRGGGILIQIASLPPSIPPSLLLPSLPLYSLPFSLIFICPFFLSSFFFIFILSSFAFFSPRFSFLPFKNVWKSCAFSQAGQSGTLYAVIPACRGSHTLSLQTLKTAVWHSQHTTWEGILIDSGGWLRLRLRPLKLRLHFIVFTEFSSTASPNILLWSINCFGETWITFDLIPVTARIWNSLSFRSNPLYLETFLCQVSVTVLNHGTLVPSANHGGLCLPKTAAAETLLAASWFHYCLINPCSLNKPTWISYGWIWDEG